MNNIRVAADAGTNASTRGFEPEPPTMDGMVGCKPRAGEARSAFFMVRSGSSAMEDFAQDGGRRHFPAGGLKILSILALIACISATWFIAPAAARLDPVLDEALQAHKVGDVKKAVEIYSEYISNHPKSAEAYNWRGMAYEESGDHDKALSDYNQAISLNPNYSDPYNNRGEIYRKKQDYPKALADYFKAIQLENDFVEPLYNIGLVYEAQGQPRQAADSYLKYVKAAPAAGDKKEILTKIQELMKAQPTAPPPPRKPAASPGSQKPAGVPPGTVAQAPPAPGAPAQQPAPQKRKFQPGMTAQPDDAAKKAAPQADQAGALSGLPIPAESLPVIGMLLGLGFVVILGVIAPVYIFITLMLFLIAKKTAVDRPWLAFVPFANLYLMVLMAEKPVWWFGVIMGTLLIAVLVQVVGILPGDIAGAIFWLALLANFVLLLPIWMGITKSLGKPLIWALLTWLPCTHPIGLAYLALSK